MDNTVPKLKITGVMNLPDNYDGEPMVITITITDETGGLYESEINFDNGYDAKHFQEACCASFLACDAPAISVNVQSVKIKK